MAKFFIIALTVMLVMLGYVSWHVWRVLPFSTAVKTVVIVLMFAALACMVMQFKSDSLPLAVATAMYEIGNSWLIIMFYLLMAFLLLDIGRLVHLVPGSWLKDNAITTVVLTGLMLTTFIAGIFRSVRFGAASSHGKANMMCFNSLKRMGAFTRDENGVYTINYKLAKMAIAQWAGYILMVQGDGDFQTAVNYRTQYGVITPELQQDLDRINNAGIPRDIRFNQGLKTLGL